MGHNIPGATKVPRIPGDVDVVAPYAADIDTTFEGSVLYTDFISPQPDLRIVSNFVRYQTRRSFLGTRMVVAEWRDVPQNFRHLVMIPNGLVYGGSKDV